MKASRLLAFFAMCLIPAVATAQIVIEGISDEDPNQPLEVQSDEGGSTNGSDGGEAAVEAEPEGMSDEDQEALQSALVEALTKQYSKCLKIAQVKRPDAGAEGTATYKVDAEGKAKAKESTTNAQEAMFFRNDKELKETKKDIREQTSRRGNVAFATCAQAPAADTGVEGPATVTMSFSIGFAEGDAAISVSTFNVDVPKKKKKKKAEAEAG